MFQLCWIYINHIQPNKERNFIHNIVINLIVFLESERVLSPVMFPINYPFFYHFTLNQNISILIEYLYTFRDINQVPVDYASYFVSSRCEKLICNIYER